MITRISPHFYIYEFVPKLIFNQYGSNSKWFIRPDVINLAEFYRRWFEAPVRVNNWFWGGIFQNRGFRTPNTTVGSLYSQHKLGAAFDCDVRGLSANDVRREIMDNEKEFMNAGLTTLEDEKYAPTWVHSDIRPTDLNKVLIVKPS